MPTSWRRSFFPCLTRIDPRRLIEVGFGERECLVDPQPRTPEHDDQVVEPVALASVMGLAHDRDDLDRWWISGVALALAPWCLACAEPRHRRGRASPAGGIDERLNRRHGSLL